MKVSLPVYIDVPKKTKKDQRVYLNLNVYRNLNSFLNGQTKTLFGERVGWLFRGKKFRTPLRMIFTYYSGSKMKKDLSNVCIVVDKFICDVLVKEGCIEDDSIAEIPEVDYRYGGLDPGNARVDLEIVEI